MTKVCCFDLDGTLLQFDSEQFLDAYMRSLAGTLSKYMEPKQFIRSLWAATEVMVKNTEAEKTNEAVFEEQFLQLTGFNRDEIWPLIDHFYSDTFVQFERYATKTPLSRQVVEAAIERGYKVVLATNPVFPRTAVVERMRWAGIEDLPFDLVTTYETSHFCKPRPQYYAEIAEKMNVSPEDCIMIGNDRIEDLVASTLGMKTFLVLDQANEDEENRFTPDQEGTLEDLLRAMNNGEGIFSK